MDLKYGIKLCITAFSNNEVIIDLEKSNFSGVVEAKIDASGIKKG